MLRVSPGRGPRLPLVWARGGASGRLCRDRNSPRHRGRYSSDVRPRSHLHESCRGRDAQPRAKILSRGVLHSQLHESCRGRSAPASRGGLSRGVPRSKLRSIMSRAILPASRGRPQPRQIGGTSSPRQTPLGRGCRPCTPQCGGVRNYSPSGHPSRPRFFHFFRGLRCREPKTSGEKNEKSWTPHFKYQFPKCKSVGSKP